MDFARVARVSATGFFSHAISVVLLVASGTAARAEPPHVEQLSEQVIMLQTRSNPDVFLETTIYKPDGPGPFPLVVINHGSTTHPRDQPRYQPISAARYFLERGYLVAAPMRKGFSKSTGVSEYRNCDVQSEAISHAQDIRDAAIALEQRTDVDAQNVLLVGQSHGGFASLAAASEAIPGMKGVVVFAGALGNVQCADWPRSLVDSAQHFGHTSQAPTLWFYGANDHFVAQTVARSMASAYSRAGGTVRLIAFPPFKDEGHFLLDDPDGRQTWDAPLTEFLMQTALPYRVTHPEYTLISTMPKPKPTVTPSQHRRHQLSLRSTISKESLCTPTRPARPTRNFCSRPATGLSLFRRPVRLGGLRVGATTPRRPCRSARNTASPAFFTR